MRLIGTLEGRQRAELFVAYLIAQRMRTIVEPQSGATDVWEVWICDEDQVATAKSEFEQFRATSDFRKYEEGRKQAEELLKAEQKRVAAVTKNIKKVTYSGQGAVVSGWPPPITLTILVIASLVSLVTGFGSPDRSNGLGKQVLNELSFVDRAAYEREFVKNEGYVDPALSLKKGELWRAITPIFLHFHALHLLFNLLTIVPLGRLIERYEGATRYGIILFITAVASNLLQGLMPEQYFGSPLFGGLSGVAFGLFGYLWVKTTLQPDIGFFFPTSTITLMLIWLVVGFTGTVGPIANLAHLGGLLSGMAMAWLFVQFPASNKAR